MSLIVKICGLSTPATLDVALEAGADMVGFVFFPPSPRNLGIEAARALGERVASRAKKVPMVNQSRASLAKENRAKANPAKRNPAKRNRPSHP